jgi:hypothetical protein
MRQILIALAVPAVMFSSTAAFAQQPGLQLPAPPVVAPPPLAIPSLVPRAGTVAPLSSAPANMPMEPGLRLGGIRTGLPRMGGRRM